MNNNLLIKLNKQQEKDSLNDIVVQFGKDFGNFCCLAHGSQKNDEELKKELGSLICNSIKWCDDLGYDFEECIKLAIE